MTETRTPVDVTGQQHLRVRIDPIRCAAFGFCAEYAPELFDLDDWGYAWLRASGQAVPPELEALARDAARLCPRRAILLETVETAEEPVSVERSREGD